MIMLRILSLCMRERTGRANELSMMSDPKEDDDDNNIMWICGDGTNNKTFYWPGC